MKTTLTITRAPLAGATAGVGTADGLDTSVAVGGGDRHGAPIGAVDSAGAAADLSGAGTSRRRIRAVRRPVAHRSPGWRCDLAASMECTWCGHVPQPPREAG